VSPVHCSIKLQSSWSEITHSRNSAYQRKDGASNETGVSDKDLLQTSKELHSLIIIYDTHFGHHRPNGLEDTVKSIHRCRHKHANKNITTLDCIHAQTNDWPEELIQNPLVQ
jgi:hypothetical protein